MAIGCPLACAAFGIYANITSDQSTRIDLLFLAGLLCFFSTLFLFCLSFRYRATHEGLFVAGVCSETLYPWHTLSLTNSRRSSIDGKVMALEVTDGHRSIDIASSGTLRDFDLLTQEIIRRVSFLSIPAATVPAQFHSPASRWLLVVFVVVFLIPPIGLAVLAVRDSSIFALVVSPIGLFPVAMAVWEFQRSIHGIAADSNGVTLCQGFRTRHIPWDRLVIQRIVQPHPEGPISRIHIRNQAAPHASDAILVCSRAAQPIAKLLIDRGRLHRWSQTSTPPNAELFVRLSHWYLFPQLWILFVVFAGLAWLLSYFELPRETWLGVAFCCSALLTCVVYTFVHSINALHATPDGLHVTAPFRHAFIPWDQLHVTQCHRESPEGKIISIRFGSPPKLWSLNLFHNKSQNIQTICNIILSRAPKSTPLPAQ